MTWLSFISVSLSLRIFIFQIVVVFQNQSSKLVKRFKEFLNVTLHFSNIFFHVACNLLSVVATVPRGDICAGASGMGAETAAASSLRAPVAGAPAAASEDRHPGPGRIGPWSPWAAPRVLAAAQGRFLFLATAHCSIKLHLEIWVLR